MFFSPRVRIWRFTEDISFDYVRSNYATAAAQIYIDEFFETYPSYLNM